MRLLAKVTIPLEEGDERFRSEVLPRTMQSAMQRLQPEASYFYEEDGKHECVFVFNLDLPSLLNPLFPNLDASFHVTPVMNAAEFARGLGDAKGKQPPVDESEFLADISPVAAETPGRPFRGSGSNSSLASDDERRAKKP